MTSLIQKLIPIDELKETVTRFPLSIICGIALFILLFCGNHEILDNDDEFIGKICAILGCGYFWFGVAQLLADRHNWSLFKQMAWAIPVMAGIAALIFTTGAWAMPLMFIMPALLLLIMVAPYLTGGDDLSFWYYNRQLWFGVIVSYAVLILFAAGLSIALAAIDKLFGVDIDWEIYLDIWMFSSLVLGAIYALSWVPKSFEFSESQCDYPPGFKFIVNWISVPMVFVYLLILYVYFVKISIEGILPIGLLAYMISGFVGAGVVTYLVSWPIRNTGSPQLRIFHKIFFPALIIPVGYHFFAIIERVMSYGVTEQRYMLLLSAMWFGFLAIAFTMAKSRVPIKAIPATLAILLVFASFGPWGGVSLSGASQYNRLKNLLIEHKAFVDGKIVKVENAQTTIPYKDRRSISSILQYLCRSDRDAMIKDWFDGIETWKCYAHDLTKEIGFKFTYYKTNAADSEYFSISAYDARNQSVDIQGYKTIAFDISLYPKEEDKLWKNAGGIKVHPPTNDTLENLGLRFALDKSNTIYIKLGKDIIKKYDLAKFLDGYKTSENLDYYPVLDIENDRISARLIFSRLSGEIKDGKSNLRNAHFKVAFTLKEFKEE
mgnify:CR=1 FL=1